MSTDIEKLEAVLGVARKSLVSLFTSYRKVLDNLDIMTLLIRKMKDDKKRKEAGDDTSNM